MQCLAYVVLLVASYSGMVSARPQLQQAAGIAATPIPIMLDERVPIDALGGFGFRIQTGNGISWEESNAGTSVQSATGPVVQAVRNGAYSFTHPDGTVHQMTYVADGAGFRPQSNMIPTPYPLLPWQLEQVQFAEEQRRLQAQAAPASG